MIQAICFKETGKYIKTQKDLAEHVSVNHKMISETFLKLKNGGKVEFEQMSVALLEWAKKLI